MRERFASYIQQLQDNIVNTLETSQKLSKAFRRERWDRSEGGGGHTCTFAGENADVIEKAGVNTSVIHGTLNKAAIQHMRTNHAKLRYDQHKDVKLPFYAAGISIVIHPRSSYLPSVHANYRYFEVTDETTKAVSLGGGVKQPKVLVWWFGGITDLTPAYLYEEDIRHFHRTLKEVCDAHEGGNNSVSYKAIKKSCDDYLYIPHRGEHRGVGGIRFDELSDECHDLLPKDTVRPRTPEEILAFVSACGDAFLPSYLPLLVRPHLPLQSDPFLARRWQLLRRGRYVEFNLVCERGTKFGLAIPGVRAENVLMSLPGEARWEYCCELSLNEKGAPDNSEEGKMLQIFKSPQNWVE